MSCSVPSCNNTIGALFPKDSFLREKWLRGLNLKHSEVQPGGFVCFDHFKEADLQEIQNGKIKLKAAAVPILHHNLGTKDVPKICRTCMSDKNLVKIWQPFDENISIMSVLMLCCYPVKISLTDNLPKDICEDCLTDLKVAQGLRRRCLDSIKKIQISVESQQAIKRKLAEEQELLQKKFCFKTVEEEDGELQESIENIKKELESAEFLQFKKPKEQVENICTIDKIASNPMNKEKPNCSLVGQKILLPRRALEKYASPVGKFPCSLLNGMENSVFVEADSYLYAHGLHRQNVCRLECILPNCGAQGNHAMVEKNCYDGEVEITKPHNHPPPTKQEQKKQMFFYVMRWKVQLDKSLNVKSLYEQFCQLEPTLKEMIPMRCVINEICKNPSLPPKLNISSFENFFQEVDSRYLSKLHFTVSGQQFYQEKFHEDDGSLAVVFSNQDILERMSESKVMYVDASFKIDNNEDFKYQLVTVLLWVDDCYYPVLYGFINKKSRDIFKKMFEYLHDVLAPNLRPSEIVTDYEANLYYALGETYLDSHIGGSIFYYTQNLYKKVCALNLSRDLETNSYFRSIYHMLLMLPLLPVNTIPDGLNNIVIQAKDMGLSELMKPIFDHVHTQWMENVTPELFCVHCLENRINENVIAPFKKLADFLIVSKGKANKPQITITYVVKKLIELEAFLNDQYTKQDKKSFGRDLSSSQKKNVLRAWLYIETHPKININNFFTKVLGYIKCMENQLWIWGYYRYIGDSDDVLISASNFSIMSCVTSQEDQEEESLEQIVTLDAQELIHDGQTSIMDDGSMIIMEAVLDQNGKVLIQSNEDSLRTYLDSSKVFDES